MSMSFAVALSHRPCKVVWLDTFALCFIRCKQKAPLHTHVFAGVDLHAASQEFKSLQLAPSSSDTMPELGEAEYVRLRELQTGKVMLERMGKTWKDASPDSAAGILLNATTQKEINQLTNKLAHWERNVLKVCCCLLLACCGACMYHVLFVRQCLA